MSPLHSSQFLHKKASFLCRLGSVLLVTLVAGCSFQAHRPAPVESIYGVKRPAIERGSIRSDTYKVKKGDTLYSIAWGAGKDYAQIAKLNQLDKSYTIYPGQVLILDSKKMLNRIHSRVRVKTPNPNLKNQKIRSIKNRLLSRGKPSLKPSKISRKKHLIPNQSLLTLYPMVNRMLTMLSTSRVRLCRTKSVAGYGQSMVG